MTHKEKPAPAPHGARAKDNRETKPAAKPEFLAPKRPSQAKPQARLSRDSRLRAAQAETSRPLRFGGKEARSRPASRTRRAPLRQSRSARHPDGSPGRQITSGAQTEPELGGAVEGVGLKNQKKRGENWRPEPAWWWWWSLGGADTCSEDGLHRLSEVFAVNHQSVQSR